MSIDAITTIGNYYPLQIRFSNDKKNRDARLPVTENKQWKLMDGDGVKTVYMQIQDAQGNTNIEDISDTIILYTTPGIIQETQSGIYVTTPSGSIIT